MNILHSLQQYLNFNGIIQIVLTIVAVMFSITLHEFFHGFAAYKLGDDTAKIYGRLSLNPLKHIDWIGAICLAIFRFGWAKPVPVNPYNLKNPKRDMVIVSLAGPLSNFVLSFVSLFFYALIPPQGLNTLNVFTVLRDLFAMLFSLNIGLCVFNLIPVPPLDGSKVLAAFLPDRAANKYLMFGQYGTLLLLLLLWFDILTPVLRFFTGAISNLFITIISFFLGVV